MKIGDLVKYSWAGSNRVALILDIRLGGSAAEAWVFGARDRMLIQWLTGAGPKPRMYNDNGTACYPSEGVEIGWVPMKNAHGWWLFDKVASLF